MKKLWKKGLPALLLLVFGAALAGCDNGTTSNTGNSPYDTKLAAEKLAYQLNDIMRSATRAQSGIDQVTLSAPGTIWGTPNKNDNINIAIPKGVTLKLDSINYLTLAATESGGAVTFTFSGEGTLDVKDNLGSGTFVGSLNIDDTQGDVTVIIGTGLTVKYGAVGAITLSSSTSAAADITGTELQWQKGATFEAAATTVVLIPGILPSDGLLNLAVSAASGVTFPTNTVRTYGTLTIKKGGDFAAEDGGINLQLGDVFVESDGMFTPAAGAIGLKVGKITYNSTATSEPVAPFEAGDVVINRGDFSPVTTPGIKLGNVTINANGKFSPQISVECGDIVVNTNGILAAGAAGEDLIFPGKLTVANGGIVDLSEIADATNSVSFGGAVVNNGKIDVAATLLKVTELTNDTKGKISIGAGGVRISGIALGSAKFLNGGVIEITADTAADAAIDIIGGTFTNKGTIRISESADAPVAAVLSFTSSKFILEPNSKLDGVLVAGTGTMPDNPNTPPELSLELGAGSFEEFTDTPGTLQGFIKSLPVTADDTNALRGSIIAKNRWEATAGSTAAVFTADDALTGSFVFNFS